MSYRAAGPSGCDDAQHGPRPVHGERHNWPGRGSPSPVTQSANGSLGLASFVISENLKRVPHWDSVGKYLLFLSRGVDSNLYSQPCIWSKNN